MPSAACQRIADLLSDLLDGELDAPVRGEVTGHLVGCAECSRLAAELAATVMALHRLRRQAGCGSPMEAVTPSRGGTSLG